MKIEQSKRGAPAQIKESEGAVPSHPETYTCAEVFYITTKAFYTAQQCGIPMVRDKT